MVDLAPSPDDIDAAFSYDGDFGAEPGMRTTEPAIDLVHLARQTMGDQALEIELLELFDAQSARIISHLSGAQAGDAKLCGDLAHTLRGSALAIGANRVARTAQAYEALRMERSPSAASLDGALTALRGAVAEARASIAALLA
jgi:HPt (histidine-containing phosphotransfer) domain-containing protein